MLVVALFCGARVIHEIFLKTSWMFSFFPRLPSQQCLLLVKLPRKSPARELKMQCVGCWAQHVDQALEVWTCRVSSDALDELPVELSVSMPTLPPSTTDGNHCMLPPQMVLLSAEQMNMLLPSVPIVISGWYQLPFQFRYIPPGYSIT